MTLAKTDMSIAGRYVSTLVPAEHRGLFDIITAEHTRTVDEVMAVTGEGEVLDRNRVLHRTLRIRDVYIDPISYLQVALLDRARRLPDGEPDPALGRALLLTINGLAAGLRNTG
jgi:phosphoenolpyruvate carboxylase